MLWGWHDLYHDLIGFFLTSKGRVDSLSLYGAGLQLGVELPWSLVIAAWAASLAFLTLRMRRTLSGFLFTTASVWLAFFLFGKQAFINYYYLICFAILLAVAASPRQRSEEENHDAASS